MNTLSASLFFLLAWPAVLCAQIDAPKPAFHETQTIRRLAVIQAAVVAVDAITTRRAVTEFNYYEANPVTRPLIGRQPTVARMSAFGVAEVLGTYLLAKRFPRAKWIQVAAIVAHTGCITNNLVVESEGKKARR